jgi:outer membrane protein OmpA-like peptidoglycan-associated protein
MKLKLVLVIMITSFFQIVVGQSETYTVKKAYFSSDKYDEFSPVFYKQGIVFCSNRNSNSVSDYYNQQNKGLFKIYYVDTINKGKLQSSKLFSKNLKTRYNDGPVTFSSKGDTIYYSRNLEVKGKLGDISNVRNKLGIFYAIWEGKEWTKIRELRINDEWYNVTTPCLSYDGKRLYFASDKPGGFGGSDLYYCQLKNDYWGNPVNLGPNINTPGNEVYPFVNQIGELFFSSDGYPGLGGKDIFFSKFADTTWLVPVHLDPPINSMFDDFGIVTDSEMKEGYFSSNRDNSIDIYKFRTNFLQLFYSENQRINQNCFQFVDDSCIDIDPVSLQFEWDFGDGKKVSGLIVTHCFPGPGKYSVKQNIIEKKSGRIVCNKLSYDLEIKLIEQPFITCDDVVVAGDPVPFDGLKSYLPGYQILEYKWDFGDGVNSKGDNVTHVFKEKGEYLIKLGLTVKQENSGIIKLFCVSKKLIVSSDAAEMAAFTDNSSKKKAELPDIINYDHAIINTQYSANIDLKKEAVFQVELLSSKTRNSLAGNNFNEILTRYTIKEIFQPDKNLYSYIIDEETSLMAAYPAFRDAISLGFKDSRIKTFIHSDPAEKELSTLKRVYGSSADAFFENNDYNISTNGFPILDQIAGLMKKYPAIKLVIGTHTDNAGLPASNLALSRSRAERMVNYLISRGINSNRLIPAGYGGTRPIVSNYTEADRKKNRRVDFIIINK